MTHLRRGVVLTTSAVIALATASAASAADRYLATGGVDASTCSDSAAPCRTWEYAQVQATVGDTVHFAAGTYPATAYTIEKSLTLAGPQAGVAAPGRAGAEAILTGPGEASTPVMRVSAPNVSIDGIAFGPAASVVHVSVGAADATIANVVDVLADSPDTENISIAPGADVTVLDSEVRSAGIPIHGLGDIAVTGSVLESPTTAIWADGQLTATSNTMLARGIGFSFAIRGAPEPAAIHGNRFFGWYSAFALEPSPSTDATYNWYGCNAGPDSIGCVGASTTTATAPHLVLVASDLSPQRLPAGATADLTATLRGSDGSPSPYPMPPDTVLSFETTRGSMRFSQLPLTDVPRVNTLQTSSTPGSGDVRVALDNQSVYLPFRSWVPSLVVGPASAAFGDVTVGSSSATRTFSVTNDLGAPARIRTVSLQGANAGDFTLWADGCRVTLPDGGSCVVSAALRPASSGTKNASIAVVASSGPAPAPIALTGTARSAPTLSVSPATADLGRVSVGGASPRQQITLQNTGSAPLQIASITPAGSTDAFAVSAGACRTTLLPTAICTISASFRPVRAGAESLAIRILATGQSARTVTLTATGVPAALTVSPASRDFGTVRIRTSTQQVFTVTNNGATAAAVDLGAIGLGGPDAAEYTLYASGCAKRTLAIGQSCQVSVFLRPQSTGAKLASVSVSATGQPARTIALSGTATS